MGAASGFSESRSEGTLCSLDDVVREHIEAALNRTGGKIHGPGGAGELLGVHPDTLRKKMKKMGIVRPSAAGQMVLEAYRGGRVHARLFLSKGFAVSFE